MNSSIARFSAYLLPLTMTLLCGGIEPSLALADVPVVSGSRLRAVKLLSADGARAPHGWMDTSRSVQCQFRGAADGVLRCLPQNAAYIAAGIFADSECREPLALQATVHGSVDAQYVLDPSNNAVYELVTDAVGPNVFVKSGSACISTPRAGNGRWVRVGKRVPDTVWQSAELQID